MSRTVPSVRGGPDVSSAVARGSSSGAPLAGTLPAPDLIGMIGREARRVTRLSDLRVVVVRHPTREAMWDRVVTQHPAPGATLSPGDTVSVTVGERPTEAEAESEQRSSHEQGSRSRIRRPLRSR
jgi:beta-lactam-binding protein with PASTA domain